MLLSYAIVFFVLIWKYEISDKKSQCRVSDTQVTFKACGPLVYSSPSHFFVAYYNKEMVLRTYCTSDSYDSFRSPKITCSYIDFTFSPVLLHFDLFLYLHIKIKKSPNNCIEK